MVLTRQGFPSFRSTRKCRNTKTTINNKHWVVAVQAHLQGYSGLLVLFGPAALGYTLAANGNLNRVGSKTMRNTHNIPKQPRHKNKNKKLNKTNRYTGGCRGSR